MIKRVLFFSVLTVCLSACKEKIKLEDPPNFSGFIPVQEGLTRYFNVDTIQWDDFTGMVDTVSWQVREQVGESYFDLLGRPAQRLIISQRQTPADAWTIDDIGALVFLTSSAERTVDNLRYQSLVFPARVGKSWDGTAFIGDLSDYTGVFNPPCITELDFIKNWDFEYTQVSLPVSHNGFEFDETLWVAQEGDSSLFAYAYGEERFARNVGLYYKEFHYFSTQDTDFGMPWESRVECGYSVRMSLYDFDLP